MRKLPILTTLILIANLTFAQNFDLKDYPVKWSENYAHNSLSYLIPIKDSSIFPFGSIYFEKEQNSSFIRMRYRVDSNKDLPYLYIKDGTPELYVKLGDGTILKAKKERTIFGITNFKFVFDTYFNLDKELQNKILKYGVEKIRIAYVFNYGGLNMNQIFDGFGEDCEIPGLTVQMLLKQIINANIDAIKEKDKKNDLDSNF